MSKERSLSAKNRLLDAAARETFKILIPKAEVVADATKITYADDFFTRFLPPMQTGDFTPIYVACHSGHGQGIPAGESLDKMRNIINRVRQPDNKFPGWTMLIAASVLEGFQGPMVEQGVRQTLPFLERRHVGITEIVRPEDIKRYNMTQNLREVYEELKEAATAGYGIVLFPEGSVQSGRTNRHFNEVFGMRQFKEVAIKLAQRAIKAAGKKDLWIPVASQGDRDLLSPDNFFLTRKSIAAVARVGDPALVKIFVETPFRGDQAPKNVPLADFLGSKIARHLLPEEQGYYRNMRY